jgi:CubicO group peptidase (beta-lactamase class C family)
MLLVVIAVLTPATIVLQPPYVNAAPAMPRVVAPDFAAIDAYVEAEMQATRLPGVALGIVQGDQIVHLRGFGTADPSGRVVTPQTPFTIGSTTKSFTALATMQLVEAGKMELDAPVQRYLPWFAVADPGAADRITVRHLLNQTSGFPTREPAAQLVGRDSSEGALEQYVRALRMVHLTTPVGTTFQYSNTNFNVLGLLVQTVSGQSYEQYVQQHIFAPLGMRSSFTSPEEARAHGRATGYRYWFGRPMPYEMPYNRAQLPSGFIHASAEDMTHYLIAQLNGGRYGAASVLSPTGMAQMHQPTVPIGYDNAAYGMGWFVSDTNGVPMVSHGGDTANFHADLILVPDSRWGIVLLMNGNNGVRPERITAIATGVTSLVMGKQPPPVVERSSFRQTLRMYVLIVLAVQVLGLVRSGVLLRRWYHQPARRPRGWVRVALRVVPSLLLSLVWAVLGLTIMPLFLGAPLLVLPLFAPDLGYALLLSLGIALGWGLLRPILVFLVLRTRRVSQVSGASSTTGVPVKV